MDTEKAFACGVCLMPKTRLAYPLKFHWQMVDLVRAGRDPIDLARASEPSDQIIRN